MKSKDQTRLEEAYQQIVENGNQLPTVPKEGDRYMWIAGGYPYEVTITGMRESTEPASRYSNGDERPAHKSLSVEIEFIDRKGNKNKFFTPWMSNSFHVIDSNNSIES